MYGWCKYGNKCSFAHGTSELRNKPGRNSAQKTKQCKTFSKTMVCPYGTRCSFVHNPYTKERQKRLAYSAVLKFNLECAELRAGPIGSMVGDDECLSYVSMFKRY